MSIEPYWRNVIDSVERTERLFRDVASPGLRLVMDPCNYPRKEDLPQLKPLIENVFQRVGDKIVVAHAKDVAPAAEGTDLPAAGLGVLDYPHYLRLLAGLDRPMPLIVEHVALDDVGRARDFVRRDRARVSGRAEIRGHPRLCAIESACEQGRAARRVAAQQERSPAARAVCLCPRAVGSTSAWRLNLR